MTEDTQDHADVCVLDEGLKLDDASADMSVVVLSMILDTDASLRSEGLEATWGTVSIVAWYIMLECAGREGTLESICIESAAESGVKLCLFSATDAATCRVC